LTCTHIGDEASWLCLNQHLYGGFMSIIACDECGKLLRKSAVKNHRCHWHMMREANARKAIKAGVKKERRKVYKNAVKYVCDN